MTCTYVIPRERYSNLLKNKPKLLLKPVLWGAPSVAHSFLVNRQLNYFRMNYRFEKLTLFHRKNFKQHERSIAHTACHASLLF